MHDLERALADIGAIQAATARSQRFGGLAPAALGLSALLALLAAAAQAAWPERLNAAPLQFLALWLSVALIALSAIAAAAALRARHDGGALDRALGQEVLFAFAPAGVAGAALTLVLWRAAPDALWLAPGLWQILLAMAVFASLQRLPPMSVVVASWYLLAGVACLLFAAESRALEPWAMGAPFAIGQAAMALIAARGAKEGPP